MNNKKVLITICKDIMRRNILDTAFWPKIQQNNPQTRFLIVVDNEKVDYFTQKYGSSKVAVRGYSRKPKSLLWKIAIFAVRTSLSSHTARRYIMLAYTLGNASLLLTVLKMFIWSTLARLHWYKKFVRQLVLWFVKSPQIQKIFDEEKPDLIFTPSLIDNNFDVPFAAEAKRRGIRVVGMVRSWDNLTSHSLLGVLPDRMLHQNKFIKESATGKFQDISEDKHGPMDVIGLPHYDLYKNINQYIVPKEEYFKEKGLDPNKKLIFLVGPQFYRSTYILPSLLNSLIEKGDIKKPSQVLFRPHPRRVSGTEEKDLQNTKHIVLDKGSRNKVLYSDTKNFINAFYHSDVVISVQSTTSVDASVFDKPLVDVNFDDPNKKEKYWTTVRRLFDMEDHYERVVEIGATRIAHSPDELTKYLNQYLEDPSLDREARKEVLNEFVEPFDGKAGERLAGIITEEIKRM